MSIKKKYSLIRAVCWIGAAVDIIWAAAFAFPVLFTLLTGREGIANDLSMRLISGAAASLLAGWSLLLIWTAQRPVQRRGVMAITAFPVVAGLFFVTLAGYMAQGDMTQWILFKTAGLFAAMLWGFFTANTLAKEGINEIR